MLANTLKATYCCRRCDIDYKEWLNGDELGINIFENKYRFNGEDFDHFVERVSYGDDNVAKLIREKKFLFGGRILSNRGTGKKATMMNCYSRGFVEDSLDDIMKANTDIAKTFQAQGGQGLSVSKIRPKGAGVNNGQYTSDGIVPFMNMFNTTAESLNQGDGRRGALLISLDAWHKEAETFIRIKSEQGVITKANLSLEIDDEFMKCVKEYYETGEEKTLHIKKDYNGNLVEYDVIPIKLYKLMMQKAWEWGEPGCLFVNEFRNYNIMEFVDHYKVENCNPCLHPDTIIQTTEGAVKIKDMDKPMMVYCMDEEHKLTIRKSSPSFISKNNAETLCVKLSNGNEIKLTPEHKVYIKGNGWVEAKNLKYGDMPILFSRSRRGAKYAGVSLNSGSIKDNQVMEHRLVYSAHYGEIPDGYDIHHKDNDTYNNHYKNLEMISHSEHATLTRYSCDNDHMVNDEKTGRFISTEFSKHGAKTIVDIPEELKVSPGCYTKVISVTKSDIVDVYDINVDEFHNFVANGMIVHNCGVCSPQYNNLVKSVKPKSMIW